MGKGTYTGGNTLVHKGYYALHLIAEHDGNRHRINAELLDRKRRSNVQEAEASANLL